MVKKKVTYDPAATKTEMVNIMNLAGALYQEINTVIFMEFFLNFSLAN